MALSAACVTLFYCLFLFQGYRQLFRDSDAGWHIRTGEAMLSSGVLPRTDPYSFTREGQPWFAWEWLADVAAGAVHRAAGLTGVALFYGAAIGAGVWLWFQLHWALDGNFLLACAAAPLLLSTCNIHWLARPHVIGWLFLLAAVWWCERTRTLGSGGRDIAAIAAFSGLWANVHASFFLGTAVAAIYAVGGAAGAAIWSEGRATRSSSFIWAAAVSAAAALANPYGWHLYAHVFRYLTDSVLLARIGEFQSFDFHAPGSGQIIATLILGMAGGVLALAHRRAEHFALAVLITALALRSARALPMAALVLLPIANGAFTRSLERAPGLQRWIRSAIDSFLAYSRRLRTLDSRFGGFALAPLILLACLGVLRTPAIRAATGFPPDQFPVAAYDHIPPDARLFATDKFGGYLIYRSSGGRKVFFDGRSDLYGAEFLMQYARLVQARPGWRQYWESYHFSHALMPPDCSLVPALEQIGWKPVYRDGTAILLARNGTW